MDRRKKRTSTNQYMMYIEMMEKDPIFATGRIPRDVDMNYLHERWKELSDKLNTCASGPKLTASEWRKRLNDWKNTTRCKYRRSITSEDITLTSLELKALQLFGKAPNVNSPTDELSVHLKSEKEENEDDMEHQRTSETFQKELQAAVEEAIGDDEDEEMMDEPEEACEMLTDSLATTQVAVAVSSDEGDGGAGGGSNNQATTTYRTILVENGPYTETEEIELIPQRRQLPTTSCSSGGGGGGSSNVVFTKGNTMQAVVTSNSSIGATVTKLMNNDITLKRTRPQAQEHIIYEVSSMKKMPQLAQHPPSQPQQQQQQRIIRTIHSSDIQQQKVEPQAPAVTAVIPTSTSLSVSSADGREIARQLKRLADIKAEKLKFEVARFKFNNPGFVFNLHQI